MAYAFDGRCLEQLLDAAERLAIRALDHEHRLAALVDRIANDDLMLLAADDVGVPALTAGTGVADLASTPAERYAEGSLLATARELCVDAREQRLAMETVLTRLLGDLWRADGKRVRVLIVDDVEDNCDLAATILERSGFDAITASNGLEGLIVAHYARPDVVLMDVSMPVLDGIATARLLKASAVTRNLKMIAFTALHDVENVPLSTLFEDVLRKPASPQAIVASVRRFAPAPATGGEAVPES